MWHEPRLALSVYLYLQYFQLTFSYSYVKSNSVSYYPTNNRYSVSSDVAPRTVNGYSNYHNTNADHVKFRHSKYPKLEKVKSSLDNLSEFSAKHPRIRHHGWSSRTTTSTTTPSLFEAYGDMEEGEVDDYDDKLEDEEDDDINYDDEVDDEDDDRSADDPFFDSLDDADHNFQAEEPVETLTPAPKPVSQFTEYKWTHYGSMNSVRESRSRQLNLQPSSYETKTKAFMEHYYRVSKEIVCRRPLPKVIPVQSEHPNPSLVYTPHCTFLHRCAEDTGCCQHDTTCRYKTRTLVHLSFYARPIGNTNDISVINLAFYNHTDCECQNKTHVTTESSLSNFRTGTSETLRSGTDSAGLAFKSVNGIAFRPSWIPENLPKCKCPEEFIPSWQESKCYCDCEELNDDCMRMKRGKEYIGLTDRLCILNSQCGTPKCEYGSYIREKGRCPKISEKKVKKSDRYQHVD